MGDRTYVELQVLEQHEQKVDDLLRDAGWYRQISYGTGIITFSLEEVNYAEIGIEPELLKQRIPYDKVWGAGSEYEKGTEYYRIRDDGKYELKSVYKGDDKIYTKELLPIINDIDHKDSKYDRLVKKILTHIEYHAPLEPLIQQLKYVKESV